MFAPPHRVLAAMLALPLAGCAVEGQNADQRGFFTGIGAAVTGADMRNVQRLEATAQQSELEARLAQRRQESAAETASLSSRQVSAAEQRLAAVQRDIARNRATMARLRRELQAGTPRATEANRLEQELNALERERRAAAARVSTEEIQRVEERSRALNDEVRRFGAM
ncbi:hypothetical protein [Sediminicoccus sp. KRV36]|uniref:hypothetical protein n=1 Tax=Sediminicoccus sp. KRV36 TaxID=3133721 RepID=UPI00200F2254|nr:hypothetical protein [Sediminicoccus rosea]UPY38945.1 hypothetical protein LHU95_09695 [Sediminicoccus rosea]